MTADEAERVATAAERDETIKMLVEGMTVHDQAQAEAIHDRCTQLKNSIGQGRRFVLMCVIGLITLVGMSFIRSYRMSAEDAPLRGLLRCVTNLPDCLHGRQRFENQVSGLESIVKDYCRETEHLSTPRNKIRRIPSFRICDSTITPETLPRARDCSRTRTFSQVPRSRSLLRG